MKQLLSLTINGTPVEAPSGIPTEGLSGGGGKIIGFGIEIMLVVCVVLALGFLAVGGFYWITSEGDKTKLESARRQIIYAILGLLLCFVSFFLVQFILGMFGINLFNVSL